MTGRIYIVEDHPLMRQMLGEFLGATPGLQVCGMAASGEEALGQLERAGADLILVDVSLPQMSGVDLVREARARWPQLRCLMLSGHDSAQYTKHALSAGAQDYVMKGDADALLDAIQRTLGSETP